MEDGRCNPVAGLLWGRCAPPRGRSPPPRRPGVVSVAPLRLVWGVCGFLARCDCVACGWGATRPGVVCVPVRA